MNHKLYSHTVRVLYCDSWVSQYQKWAKKMIALWLHCTYCILD